MSQNGQVGRKKQVGRNFKLKIKNKMNSVFLFFFKRKTHMEKMTVSALYILPYDISNNLIMEGLYKIFTRKKALELINEKRLTLFGKNLL